MFRQQLLRQHGVPRPCPVPAVRLRSRFVCRAENGKQPAQHKRQQPPKRKAEDMPPQPEKLQFSGRDLTDAFERKYEQLLEAGMIDDRVPNFLRS